MLGIRELIRASRKAAALKLMSSRFALPSTYFERYIELLCLRQLLTELEITCVLDVGANSGQFAKDLRSVGYLGQIISFEPVKKVFDELKKTMRGDLAWCGFNLALGRENGASQINVGKNTQLSSLKAFQNDEHIDRVDTVKLRRLDTIWDTVLEPHLTDRIFLKMDTQGFDQEVFAGAHGCMEQFSGLMTELTLIPLYKNTPRYLESLAVFEASGFSICNLTPVFRKPSLEIAELNCMMRRVSSLERIDAG